MQFFFYYNSTKKYTLRLEIYKLNIWSKIYIWNKKLLLLSLSSYYFTYTAKRLQIYPISFSASISMV